MKIKFDMKSKVKEDEIIKKLKIIPNKKIEIKKMGMKFDRKKNSRGKNSKKKPI
jgi:hypothetical protein